MFLSWNGSSYVAGLDLPVNGVLTAIKPKDQRPLLAGKRLSHHAKGRLPLLSHVDLLGDLERVFHLDTKVSNRTLQLRVP